MVHSSAYLIFFPAAQFFLIPVMIVTQEELITSFFIFSHLKYSPEIKRRHPGAKKWSKRNLLQI